MGRFGGLTDMHKARTETIVTAIVSYGRMYVPGFVLTVNGEVDDTALYRLMLDHWDELKACGVDHIRFSHQIGGSERYLSARCAPFLGVIRSRRYVERLLRGQNIPYARSACRIRP